MRVTPEPDWRRGPPTMPDFRLLLVLTENDTLVPPGDLQALV